MASDFVFPTGGTHAVRMQFRAPSRHLSVARALSGPAACAGSAMTFVAVTIAADAAWVNKTLRLVLVDCMPKFLPVASLRL